MQEDTKKREKLTSRQFNLIVKFYLKGLKNIADDRIEMARQVMIDGKSPSLVASNFNVSRTSVSNNINLVYKYYLFDKELAAERGDLPVPPIHLSEEPSPKNIVVPQGWSYVSLLAPTDVVDSFKELVESELKNRLQNIKQINQQ